MSADGRRLLTPQLFIGVCITLVGAVLLLNNLQLFPARVLLRLWPVALIGIGALVFVQAMEVGGRVNGAAIALVGAGILLNTLGILDIEFWDFFWPLVIILIGTSLMMQTFAGAQGASPADTVSLFAVWSGSKRVSNAAHFRGGDMTAVMGGCHLDLTQATIAEGEVAVINILGVMGGHEIRVPENWSVVTRIFPLMGGVDDKTAPLKGATSTLILRGLVVMGGVEIRH